jgi:hypothetical protein
VVVSELLIFVSYGQWYLSNGLEDPDEPDVADIAHAAIAAGGFAQAQNVIVVLTPELHTGELPLRVEVWSRRPDTDDRTGYRGRLNVDRHGLIVSGVEGQQARIDVPPGQRGVRVLPGDAGQDPPVAWRVQIFPATHPSGRGAAPRKRSSAAREKSRRRLLASVAEVRAGSFFWDLTGQRLDPDDHELLSELAPTVTTPVCVNLYRTGLSEVPEWLRLVPDLRHLLVHYNDLTTLPSWLPELTRLQRLAIAFNRDFTTLPDLVADLPALERLEIDGTAITRLPEAMATMTRLQRLSAMQIPLAAVPDWIGHLTRLQHLEVYDTPITRLPDSIGQLHELHTLTASETALSALPESIGQLRQLRNLSIDRTPITRLPDSIGQLTNLERLNLAGTAVATVPDSLATLPNLRSLSLDHTAITSLPAALLDRAGLNLGLDGTPLHRQRKRRQ